MKNILSRHPRWVLLLLALVYSEEVILAATTSNNNSNIPIPLIKRPFTLTYNENLLGKIGNSSSTILPHDDTSSTSRIVRPAINGQDQHSSTDSYTGSAITTTTINAASHGITSSGYREARIMITNTKINKTTADRLTTDFARNTVPVKDQTQTDPTIKKTEPPWKVARKPNIDFKNKLRGGGTSNIRRVGNGGGNGGISTGSGPPPGPDSSILAFNAYTTQIAAEQITTERNIRKPFTTKSRPPPLSYLTSTIDSPPLPPTAWALTTLKGSPSSSSASSSSISSAIVSEHVRNIIPPSVALLVNTPIDTHRSSSTRTRTTIPSIKPINSFWSTRLSKFPSTSSSFFNIPETTEPARSEVKVTKNFRLTTAAPFITEPVTKPVDTLLNRIDEEKLPSELILSTTTTRTIKNNNFTSEIPFKSDENIGEINKMNETQIQINEEIQTSTVKDLNKTNYIIESVLPKEKAKKVNDDDDDEEQIEEINEAIKNEEKNKLSKIVEDKYLIKPKTFEINNIMNNIKNEEVNHTTENYGNTLTEKPFINGKVKKDRIKLINAQEVSEKPEILPSSVTEFNKIFSENIHDLAEDNFNTEKIINNPVYPIGNIINETKLTHKLKEIDIASLLNNVTEMNTETELNTVIASSLSPNYNLLNNSQINRNNIMINETDQSTTSMTRATNATQPPVNSTTESNLITTIASSKITTSNNGDNLKFSYNTEIMAAVTMTTTTTSPSTTSSTIKYDNTENDEILTTMITTLMGNVNGISEITSSALIQNVTTTISTNPSMTTQEEILNTTTTMNNNNFNNNNNNNEENMSTIINYNTPIINSENNLNVTSKANDISSLDDQIDNVTTNKMLIPPLTPEIPVLSSTMATTETPPSPTPDIAGLVLTPTHKDLNKYELNQTNNDIKLGGEIDQPIPAHISPIPVMTITTPATVSGRSNNIISVDSEIDIDNHEIVLDGNNNKQLPATLTTTEHQMLITTSKLNPQTEQIPEIITELPILNTESNFIKDKDIKINNYQNETKYLTTALINSNNTNNDAIEMTTTVTAIIFKDNDDLNEDDGIIYNTTGNDKKFPIDTNITEHELDENNDDELIISGEKELGGGELISNNYSTIQPEDTTISDITLQNLITTTETIPLDGQDSIDLDEEQPVDGSIMTPTTSTMMTTTTTSAPPTTISPSITAQPLPTSTSIASTTNIPLILVSTTPIMDDDVVTPNDNDNTGVDIEDYDDTGVIVPMNVRLLVHATYEEMCLAKDVLIDSLVRFFKTVADRPVERKQIKILNLIRECVKPYPPDKGVVPVHLLITDSKGQYDRRLTDIFISLVRQETLSFKYPITQVDKLIAHDMGMDSDASSQGGGTVIAAIVISSIAGVCLLFLTILLIIMRKRQRGFNYGQRCTPVSLDDYSLDNISVYNSVRRKAMRASKRSYGNPAFDDPAAISNSLNFAGLSNAVSDKSKLEEEFSKIPVVTVKPDELPPGAEVKNRYANVIPLPETRVSLNTPNNNDIDSFINANFVKGAKGVDKFYIACQAPMKETISDFWQMIWEQQSRIVIMLTDHHENGAEKCADYLPPSEVLDCHRVFGDLQVTLKKREAREKYIISSLQLKNLESNLWREVTHLWYVGWPGRGVPDDYSSVIAFLIEARSYAKNGPPIVVHCSPGTGRTGTIIAIDIAIRDFETDRTVDIPKTVYNIRRDRAGAVQTSQQYLFIHQVLHLYATKLTGGGLDSI